MVRVVYARADQQCQVELPLGDGMTVGDAVESSGLLRRFPEIRERPLACAIYGQSASLHRKLRGGDRIEILRPLAIDPKEKRRQSAARANVRARER